VKLFFDESVGSKVPAALRHIGAPATELVQPSRAGPITYGMADLEWIAIAGAAGYLAISHDLRVLQVPAERAALVAAGLGIVFIEAGQRPRWEVLRLLLARWEWLKQIDAHEPRPFAFILPIRGKPRQLPLA